MGRNKRDTPVKPALGRRQRYRRPPCETLPEETEVFPRCEAGIKLVQSTPALHSNSPAFTDSPRDKAISPASKTPGYQALAGHPTIPVTPDPGAPERTVKEEVPSPSMDSDTTFNCDDDDEDCYSSASSSPSCLPSPEMFRRANDDEAAAFPRTDELLGFHPNIKNSTLLDVSHAKSIHMHDSPNLSTIVDASTILVESGQISDHTGPEAEAKTQRDASKSDEEMTCKTAAKLTKKRLILYKKKVVFKSPIITQTFGAKQTPTTKFASEAAQPGAETPGAETPGASVRSSPERAQFFDFVGDMDRGVFFQMMRERSDKLKSGPLFPLTAAK